MKSRTSQASNSTSELLSESESKKEKSIASKIWSNVIGILLCKGDLSDEDQKAVKFTELFRFASRSDLVRIIFGGIFCGFGGILQPAGIIIAGLLTSLLLDSELKSDDFLNQKTPYLIAFIMSGIAGFIFTYLGSYLLLRGCNGMARSIRLKYLTAVLKQDAKWLMKHSSGSITSQLNASIQKIEEGLGNKFGMMIRGFSMYFSALVVSFFVCWRLALICMISGPLAAWSLGIMSKVTAKYGIRIHHLSTEATTIVEESIMNVRTVASCNAQDYMVQKYSTLLHESLTNVLKFEFWSGFFEGINLMECYSVMGLNIWFGVVWYFDGIVKKPADSILIGNVMGMASYHLGLLGPIMMVIVKGFYKVVEETNELQETKSAFQSRVAAASVYATIDRETQSLSDEGCIPHEIRGNIEIKNVKFGYPGRDTQILKGISWSAQSGTCIALVGKSGCGKSTSIALLTRLFDPDEGTITIDGIPIEQINTRSLRKSIGLVEQEPCLFNGTIMENIILGRDISEEAATQAAVVAKADDFIREFKDSYNTLLGVGGISLSGGQKQRIAIARAIATDPKILLLDEATSALDTESERIVQAALNRAAEGRTTIIIAHRLSTLKDVDKIYVFEGGVVIEEGTHAALLASEKAYWQLARAQEIQLAGALTPDSTQYPSSRHHSVPMSSSQRSDEETPLLNAEDFTANGNSSYPGLAHLYGSLDGNWGKFSFVILLAFLRSFEMILAVLGSTFGFDALSREYYDSRYYYARVAVAIFIGCGLVQLLIEPALHLFSGWTAEDVVGKLRMRALRSLLYRPIESFENPDQSQAACVTAIVKYSQPCVGAFNFNFAYNISNVFAVLIAIAATFYFCWEIGCLTAGLSLLLIGILIINQIFGHMAHREKALNDRTAELAIEIAEQARTIQLLTVETHFMEKYAKQQEETLKHEKWIQIVESVHFASSQMFPLLGDFSAWLLLSHLAYSGSHSIGELFRSVSYTSVALWSILYSAPYIPDYVKAGTAATELFKVIDKEEVIGETIDCGEFPKNDLLSMRDRDFQEINGHVKLKSVDFAYPSRPDILVSRQLTLSVEKGKSIALVGTSGCGKSTIIGLLERFYSAIKGSVQVDGCDVKSINARHLRSHIGLVCQQPVLFKGTILENILMGADIPFFKVVEACSTANAIDFIVALPKAYETEVGERGKALSGGQKQRIAIARALVREPKILLLDEATSALDTESEEVVQKALNNASVGRTTITIAHRLSSIQNCDLIYVIERGRVVESGSHKKLLRRGGRYTELVSAQMLNT